MNEVLLVGLAVILFILCIHVKRVLVFSVFPVSGPFPCPPCSRIPQSLIQ
jgi:hypothetical protein